jgi:hypothetical protein
MKIKPAKVFTLLDLPQAGKLHLIYREVTS